jgi:hypothetical protein
MGSLDFARDDIGGRLEGAELCSAGRAWTPVPTWLGVNGLGLRARSFESFLFGRGILQLHEVIRAYDSKDQAHWNRELLAGGIVDDGRIGQAVMTAAGLKLASGGGYDILDPLALAAVGKGDRESVGRAEDIYRSVIKLAGFSSDVSDDAEAGEPACEAAGDPISNGQVESGERFLAVAHHQHS